MTVNWVSQALSGSWPVWRTPQSDNSFAEGKPRPVRGVSESVREESECVEYITLVILGETQEKKDPEI